VRGSGTLAHTRSSATHLTSYGADDGLTDLDRDTLTDQLVLAPAGQGSSKAVMVVQAGQRLNPALRQYLRDWRLRDRDLPLDLPAVSERRSRSYALVDRLTDQEIEALVQSYLAGTSADTLAARYGISLRSVRRLLRRHGARRHGRHGEVGPEATS
jgi:hypothetical protein